MNCCVVVPVYRELHEPLEIVSFLRLRQFISNDVFIVAPDGLSLESYRSLWPSIQDVRFPSCFFESIQGYNSLMLSSLFYEKFARDFEWMLIHQLDAFLFNSNLQDFCSMPYDYYGAPWIPAQFIHPHFTSPLLLKLFGRRVAVGNGGLSLRKIVSTLSLLENKSQERVFWKTNEDGFFSYWGTCSPDFFSCPLDVASRFSFEAEPQLLLSRNEGKLPFGCHAFNKVSQQFYSEIINPLLPEIYGLEAALGGRKLPEPYKYEDSSNVS